MHELVEDENREGYERELEERLAIAGCPVARAQVRARELVDQVDADDEDLDEDELEDEELVHHQVIELDHARTIVGELDRRRDVAAARRKE